MCKQRMLRGAGLLGLMLLATFQAGCGKLRDEVGLGDFKVGVTGDQLEAGLQLTKYQANTDISIGIPQLENAFIGVGPYVGNKGILVHFRVPISSILQALQSSSMPARGLPDGRPLFGTTTAKLPSFDLTVERFNVRFYLSEDVFGVFLPLPIPTIGDPIGFPIKDARGYVVAYGAFIGPATGQNANGGGILILFPINLLTSLSSYVF